ncbi:MAG: hypothetical protein ABI707_10355 [Ferruginibacter sp.]
MKESKAATFRLCPDSDRDGGESYEYKRKMKKDEPLRFTCLALRLTFTCKLKVN